MEKIGAKGIMYTLLPLMFLLQLLSGLVGAVDIIFYESKSGCDGSGYTFDSIGTQVCCEVSASECGSVLITGTTGSTEANIYRGGGCTTLIETVTVNVCIENVGCTGAFWFNVARRRRSLLDSQSCDSQMKPTGVVYTDDGTKGNWILTTSEAAEFYSQMQNIPDAEKASWLQSHGAAYKQL